MRIVVHDYSGHPGQAQLSRALARRGHEVTHQHCPSYATGKGSLQLEPGDPPTLSFEPCAMEGTFAKYSVVTRIRQELSYGRRAARAIAAKDPAVAVISNVPLLAHSILARRVARCGVPMVFWHQDIYSEAIGSAARRRLPVVGAWVARLAARLERTIARRSGAIVAISPTFLDRLAAWGVADKAVVVPNWAPIDELPMFDDDGDRGDGSGGQADEWRSRAGLRGRQVVLYSGTLGLKHDPGILASLAERLGESHPSARVVVISEGKGRDWLEEWKHEQGAAADNLILLDFQPYADLPAVMGSADVLMAVLEPDASRFSVPSKVLTYLCAGRAIVGVLPRDNSVAEILLTHGAGLVVRSDDAASEVARLLNDEACRKAMGRAGRRYAERSFSPETAADRFEAVFNDICATSAPRSVSASARPDSVLSPDAASNSVPDGRPVTGRQTVRDQGMSWSDRKLIPHPFIHHGRRDGRQQGDCLWAVPPSRWVIEDQGGSFR
jgi:glycosyltransferase involved in cell wall biosynthesis